jgi:hypothetical protein
LKGGLNITELFTNLMRAWPHLSFVDGWFSRRNASLAPLILVARLILAIQRGAANPVEVSSQISCVVTAHPS